MKSLAYIFILALAIGCVNPKSTTNEKMRRFTFAAFNSLNDTTAFKKIISNESLDKELRKVGLINFNYCTSDSISYLVLDMEDSFNLEKTISSIAKLAKKFPTIKRLNEILSGDYQLLNRTYKMEQKQAYKAEEGQLIPLQKKDYSRFILTLEIINNPELAKDYVDVHGIGKAWPEITQNMKTVGIHEMELYLIGYRAFLIMDAKPNFDWSVDGEKWGTLPREKEWQSYVAKFQKTNPDSKAAEKWKTMKDISLN
ncbi:L-rhamnose mutarotase [Labilibacter marinus]|uniref:L-rhamnose mutarotase n=1 Tax=Labilibacter marinus TaxID=1477105 RepID=UPI0009F9194E|nr:L-rhamnose mutarotase [Labilibacter marinus]